MKKGTAFRLNAVGALRADLLIVARGCEVARAFDPFDSN
jgi:hypothetical protein